MKKIEIEMTDELQGKGQRLLDFFRENGYTIHESYVALAMISLTEIDDETREVQEVRVNEMVHLFIGTLIGLFHGEPVIISQSEQIFDDK